MKHKILKLFSMLILIASLNPSGIIVPAVKVIADDVFATLGADTIKGNVVQGSTDYIEVPSNTAFLELKFEGTTFNHSDCVNYTCSAGAINTYCAQYAMLYNSQKQPLTPEITSSQTIDTSTLVDLKYLVITCTSQTKTGKCEFHPNDGTVVSSCCGKISYKMLGYTAPRISSNLPINN